MRILLADAERESRRSLAEFLKDLGHEVIACADGRAALSAFFSQEFHLVLTELRMPRLSGMELIRQIRFAGGKKVDVVVFTGYGERLAARDAMLLGAAACLHKPIDVAELVEVIERLERWGRGPGKQGRRRIPAEPSEAGACPLINVGGESFLVCSEGLKAALRQADVLRQDPLIPVLIVGETGTGKEIIARYLHYGDGDSSPGPFVALNCAAVTPTLFEAELFGYEAGAFTGALPKGQKGKVELAAGGTLFLDEISELPPELQAKLLRLVQEREFYRVGGTKPIKANARIVCATNADLLKRVEEGTFRQDLYYRLSVGEIHLPPLRERKESIIPLAEFFLRDLSRRRGKRFRTISREAADLLLAYEWPGNVRELKNLIDWAVLMHDGEELKPSHIRPRMRMGQRVERRELQVIDYQHFDLPDGSLPLQEYIDNIIMKALEKHGGNVAKTAEYLGIPRRSFYGRYRRLLK
ncbi:MAG: sigma-54-dependent transcriptional regulator [Thermacetogeniaceae bacterium]